MKTNISEDLPARKFAPAANTGGGSAVGGGGDMEKKQGQLFMILNIGLKRIWVRIPIWTLLPLLKQL